MQDDSEKKLYNNKVSVAVVRDDSGKVLIIKRKIEIESVTDGKLTWSFPSCAVPENSDIDAIMRYAEERALEEAGYKVKALDKISERIFHPLGNHMTYIHCTLIGDAPEGKVDEEIDCHEWVYPRDLNKYFTTSIDLQVARFLGI